MKLKDKLKEISINKPLSKETRLKIICMDNQVITGNYYGYTQALDNEPEEAEVDIMSDAGAVIGVLESEIKSIEVI